MFGMAQLLLQKVELPRSFEARVKFKMPRPLAVGFVLTDPRTRRSLVPLVTESGNQLGRPSVYVQQFSTLDGVLRLVPIKESRKYTLPPGAERELRIVRIEDDLRVFVDGIEQLHEPIPLLDFTEIGLQVSDNATEGEILVWDFELRAPEKAIREQAMRTRIGKLFDEIGFKEGVRDAIRDEKRSPAERELVEKELERLVEDPWKIMTLLDAKLVEGTKPTELPQLLKQAEYLVKLAPNEWKFLMPLGVVQYRSGKYAEAIETINRSIELHRTETGSVRPVQYAQLALGYHKLNRPEEAKRMARRMYDLLNYSDHWKKDGVELTVTYEARKLFEEKETPDHEAIKRVVSRSDQDGWVLRKLDAHLSAYDPSYRFRWQRHEKPSSDDIELSFEQIRKMKQYQIPGPISSENWIDFDEMEVTVDGDRAKLNTRAGVHFGRGFDVYRSNFELRKVNGEWKLTANIAWLLEQRQEGVVVRFDEAWYREQEAIAAKLKSSDDFRGYAQLLLKLKQLAKLVAFIDQMPEGERTAEFLKIKGEALFELGKVSEAFAMFREAIKQAPALEMPWYLNPVKHQWRPDEQVGSSVVWLKDSRLLAGSGNDRRVHVWNVETGQEEFTLPETEFSIFSLAVSPDGESLAGSLGDGRILIWNLKTKESTAMCIGHTKVVYRIAFDSTGKRLVSASGDTTARVWDATNGKQLLEIRGHEDEVLGAHFSPDGTQIATASHDRTARIWDATTGKELKKFVGHQGHVKRVVWSKDGKRLFTASLDATARIWDVEKQKEIRRLVGHSSGLDVIALSPDETRIVTADFAGIVRLWDGSNYKLLRSHDRTGRPIYSLAIDAENRYLATAGADGYLVYRLQEFPE
jgi:tetratricopeptide (TPR) repeat protein